MTTERIEELKHFRMPTYREIPSVGLYLDQTSKYINECLSVLPDCTITNSMISNYVKHHLVSNPVKKQYGREQIARLIFITITKNILSLENVSKLLDIQQKTCSLEAAYGAFAEEFDGFLQNILNRENMVTEKSSPERTLLADVVSASVRCLYLNEFLKFYQQ